MDSRDLAASVGHWWSEVHGTIALDRITGDSVDIEFHVCPTCKGAGSYVNPSIDAGGITTQDMHELGEEFFDDYRSGKYNIQCAHCNGKRVVPVPTDPEILRDIKEFEEEEAMNARMTRHESGLY